MNAKPFAEDDGLGVRPLEEVHVPRTAQLIVERAFRRHQGRRRHGERNELAPALRRRFGGRVRGRRAEVVTDEHRAFVAAECGVQCVDVGRARRGGVVRIGRNRRRSETAQPWRDDMVACARQHRRQVAPGMRRIGKAVQTQRERPVGRTAREVRKPDAVRSGEGGRYFSDAAYAFSSSPTAPSSTDSASSSSASSMTSGGAMWTTL